jgi:hypothetical protein
MFEMMMNEEMPEEKRKSSAKGVEDGSMCNLKAGRRREEGQGILVFLRLPRALETDVAFITPLPVPEFGR